MSVHRCVCKRDRVDVDYRFVRSFVRSRRRRRRLYHQFSSSRCLARLARGHRDRARSSRSSPSSSRRARSRTRTSRAPRASVPAHHRPFTIGENRFNSAMTRRSIARTIARSIRGRSIASRGSLTPRCTEDFDGGGVRAPHRARQPALRKSTVGVRRGSVGARCARRAVCF